MIGGLITKEGLGLLLAGLMALGSFFSIPIPEGDFFINDRIVHEIDNGFYQIIHENKDNNETIIIIIDTWPLIDDETSFEPILKIIIQNDFRIKKIWDSEKEEWEEFWQRLDDSEKIILNKNYLSKFLSPQEKQKLLEELKEEAENFRRKNNLSKKIRDKWFNGSK